MYIFIYTYIYIHRYFRITVLRDTNVPHLGPIEQSAIVPMHTCIHTYIHTYSHTIYTFLYTYTYIYIHRYFRITVLRDTSEPHLGPIEQSAIVPMHTHKHT